MRVGYNLFCFILCILTALDLQQSPHLTADFNAMIAPIRMDFDQLLSNITHHLHSDSVLVTTITQHLFSQGGKRLRPLLVLLSARACGYDGKLTLF
jgi:hypothetical protein